MDPPRPGGGAQQLPSLDGADDDRPRQQAAASTTTAGLAAAAAAAPSPGVLPGERVASVLGWAAERSGLRQRQQAAAALAAALEAERAAWRAPTMAPFGHPLARPSAEPALAAAALRSALGLQQQQRNNNDALEAALLHRLVEREVAERRRQLLQQQQQQQVQHLQQLVNLAALGALPPPPPSAALHGGGLAVPPLAWQQQVLAQQGAAALAPLLSPGASLGVSAQGPAIAGRPSRREGYPAPARGQGPDLSRSHQRGAIAEAPVGSAAASSGRLSPAADAERRGKRRPRSPSQREPRQRRGPPGAGAGDADDPRAAAPAAAPSPPSPGLPAPMSRGADRRFLSAYQCLLRGQIEYFVATAGDAASTVQGRNVPIREGQVGIRCRHCARAAGSSAPSAASDGAAAAASADNSAAAAPSGRQRDAPGAGEAGEDPAPVGRRSVDVGGGASAAASAARWIRTGASAAAARGSAYYPLRLSSLYQAAQNMSNNHFVSRACRHAPASVVDRIEELKGSHRASREAAVAPGGEGGGEEGRIKRGRGNKYWVESAERLGIVEAADGAGLALRDGAPGRGAAPPPPARADFSP